MDEWIQKIRNHTIVLLLLFTGAVYLFLKYLSSILSPILLAILFVTVFGPFLKKMKEKFHINRQIGAAMLVIAVILLFLGLLWLISNFVWKSLPEILRCVERLGEILPSGVSGVYEDIRRFMSSGEMQLQKGLAQTAWKYMGKLAALGGYLVTFLIAVMLFAKDYDEVMNHLLDRDDCRLPLEIFCGIIRYIAVFIRAQGVIMSVIALCCSGILTIFGVKYGIVWGILAGILDALPFIGTGVVLVPLGIFCLLNGRLFQTVICVLLYVACIFIRQILEPRLIGKKVGVRPVIILICLYVGIRLFGVLGILKGPLGFVILREIWLRIGTVRQPDNSENVKAM